MKMTNKTIFITGASRGIGRAIALAAAKEGANVVIASKSAEEHPKLQGTIFSVAEEVSALGGSALPIQLDVRKEIQVKMALEQAHLEFGSIDVLVNNAGAISLTNVEQTSPKRYDLMQSVNHRAVYTLSHYAIPYLKQSPNAHILSLCPPLNLNPKWLKDYAPYTLSKYGMTLLTLGLAEELRPYSIAVNALWPKTMIATAAIEFAVGNQNMLNNCRKPDIMADAAMSMVNSQYERFNGQTLLDEDVLKLDGVEDFSHYAVNPSEPLYPDLFLD
ncbi:SDR family oxidoreductase [Pleionea litopenaei]|uniref:NAD(P)-dependent oxidoreductase n=1 Tax=Pleionea litopenaei TaxID=3070815 RepID=A0AA51RUI1_9GAMM|nr:NAD(P)-dependent oxidoreductase [Pleionea sp. HL-JVS1]WMS87739.1 NAD(P)-dependent oxidoreductase [Pleionea sp. HL-JVS1]